MSLIQSTNLPKILIAAIFMVASMKLSMAQNCWWTGCQKNSWAVVGCGQYGFIEVANKACEDGKEYNCCPPATTTTTPDYTALAAGCWWTGCQLSSWAVVGCGQYNMNEKSAKDCKGGKEYHCCPANAMAKSDARAQSGTMEAEPAADSECYWTNCQKNNTDTGCEVNQTVVDRKNCKGGNRYYCCIPPPTPAPDELAKPKERECWWTSCQPESWKKRGCASDTDQRSSKPCSNGHSYECCEKEDEE